MRLPLDSARRRQVAIAAATLLSLGGVGLIIVSTGVQSIGTVVHAVKDLYRAVTPDAVRPYVWAAQNLLLDPFLYLVGAAVFVFEWLRPASHQRLFSKGLVQDAFWFLGDGVLWVGLLALISETLRSVYDRHLQFLTLDFIAQTPAGVRIALAIVFIDFLDWARHYLKHRIWWLWVFHAVHHSQVEMNLFTDFRVHIIERIVNSVFVFIPLFMFQVSMPTDYYIALVLSWYRVVYHANIRTNYGPLKYALVTPQFHRVHHSVEARHVDTNFGVIFTFWDRLFGTHWSNFHEYPRTGIGDSRFPFEQGTSRVFVVANWLKQTAYPLAQLYSRAVAEAQERLRSVRAEKDRG